MSELKEDVILLLESYFNVLVWYGESAYGWKEQNLQEEPYYEYLQEFFSMPMRDASDIVYDKTPVSNFYETFKNDGKERYLKSRVNPSQPNKVENDGHFVSDDAPITLFMDYLIRSVINYNEWLSDYILVKLLTLILQDSVGGKLLSVFLLSMF